MKQTVLMKEMDAFTYRERLATNPIVIIPVGSLEQHGPHMPLCVDELLSTDMAIAVAERIGAVVGPAITFGYKSQQRSGGGYHLAGTVSMTGKTFIDLAKEITLELAEHGIRRFVFCNGHYENYQFLFEGVDLAVRDLRARGIEIICQLISYWDFVDDATIDRLYPEGFTGWDLEHGGVLETSLMLLLHPDLVDMERVSDDPPAVLPNYDILPIKPELTPPSGCLSSARNATLEKGRILLDTAATGMVEAIRHEF
ncbi:creatinine amidohydrolase [Actinomyces ruminicola]|uniref:Creatinine amidohydrolase n=1 Tax=Actinomyces ruminicola TaxID=332524 RepID=A0A1H0B4T5_9ACTO|nr:creatininase [Actinomyces ruminicola]SDN40695.1 creatinine amidohydrolase [Actinomyces ruminicola]